MRANNKPIGDWLEDIRRGVVRLPRFQREEAWTHRHVEAFLEKVIRGDSPIGVLLVLNINPDKPPFKTRALAGTVNNGELCRQHLLDGQQRLTALWKAMNDLYEDRSYYIPFQKNDDGSYALMDVSDDGVHQVTGYPKRVDSWLGDAKQEFQKNLMPVRLLYPHASESESLNWVNDAGAEVKMFAFIYKLQLDVESRELPFLSLPVNTSPGDAIDVFISTNTSFVKLSPYDIAVAQFESKTSNSLRELVNRLKQDAPGIEELEGEDGVGDLALKVSCLFQERLPTYGNYVKLDMKKVEKEWSQLTDGVKWAVAILAEEKIWDNQRLPSTVPLRVLPAIHRFMPKSGDARSKANRLVRQYLWRAFVTDWYDRQANDRLKKDYDALKEALASKTFKCKGNCLFGSALPNKADLMSEGFPKGRGIRKRAILAICIKHGARDIATNQKISSLDNIKSRHYHHVFPVALLRKWAKGAEPNLALNCMLLEGATNINWGDEWPGDYLLERVRQSGLVKQGDAIDAVKKRLDSHLIPSDIIISATKGSEKSLKKMYNDFLDQRAELILAKLKKLCKDGQL